MSDGSGMLVKAVIFFAIVGVVLNDAVVVASNYWLADDFARYIASETARAYETSGDKQEIALQSAYKLCEQKQSTLTGFAIESGVVIVEIETAPKKTLVAHRIKYLSPYLSGKAIARSSPD